MSFFYDGGTKKKADNYADTFGVTDEQAEAGTWTGFGTGIGYGVMRETFAKVGRAGAMGLGASVVAGDEIRQFVTGDESDTRAQDWYFKNVIDDTFTEAVDYWTPSEKKVGAAGQMAGQLVGTVGQLVLGAGNPALMVGTAQMDVGLEMVRQGVDADTAQDLGTAAGLFTGVGAWLPVFGKTGAQKILMNTALNPVVGIAQRASMQTMLENEGQTKLAQQYDPWDAQAIVLDAAMGAAFGYASARRGDVAPDFFEAAVGKNVSDAIGRQVDSVLESGGFVPKRADVDDLMAMANIKARIYDTSPGKPLDDYSMNAHIGTQEDAIRALLEDRPVDVSRMEGAKFEPDARPTGNIIAMREALDELGIPVVDDIEVIRQAEPVAAQEADITPMPEAQPEPVAKGQKAAKEPLSIVEQDYRVRSAAEALQRYDDIMTVDESGNQVSGREELRKAVREAKTAEKLGDAFRAAALCVMGA
jgi:hypothetical protein